MELITASVQFLAARNGGCGKRGRDKKETFKLRVKNTEDNLCTILGHR